MCNSAKLFHVRKEFLQEGFVNRETVIRLARVFIRMRSPEIFAAGKDIAWSSNLDDPEYQTSVDLYRGSTKQTFR